jgi:hypothetical protein
VRTIQKGAKSPSRGERGALVDSDNERLVYLRSDVIDGSGWQRLFLCDDDGSYGGGGGGGKIKCTRDGVPGHELHAAAAVGNART